MFLFRWIIPTMGDVDVRDIRGTDVNDLDAALRKKPIKPNTIKNILTCLRTLLQWLHRQDAIAKVPAFPPLSPIPRENVGWIERETQERIIAKAREDVRLLFEVMMETCIRPGEAVALKERDLKVFDDIGCGILVERALTRDRRVKATKTRALSRKPLTENLYARLVESSRDKLPEAFLFTTSVGTPYSPSHVSMLWTRAARAAGVDVCLYVAMRHSGISQKRQELERRIVDELRRELAHTSSRTTMKHYVRDDREKKPVSQNVTEG